MDTWTEFWKYACLFGFAVFYLLVLVIIPLGAIDLMKLFRQLSGKEPKTD